MITYGENIKIFCGNSNPEFAKNICKDLGVDLGKAEVKTFADGEASVSLLETVRGADVFLVQSTCKPVNDHLMELLVMCDACRRASAGRITAVIPYFGYARQDRKAKSRDPISAKLVANMLTASGADRVLTMDLHASQIQGFFDIPVDNLLGNPVFVDYYAKKFGERAEDMVVVSPDVGSVARARTFAQKLHMSLAIVDKRRQKANQCEVMNVIGDVAGKDCILFDDMIDTAGTICEAVRTLKGAGAKSVTLVATHGLLSGPAIERLRDCGAREIVLMDTVPVPEEKRLPKMLDECFEYLTKREEEDSYPLRLCSSFLGNSHGRSSSSTMEAKIGQKKSVGSMRSTTTTPTSVCSWSTTTAARVEPSAWFWCCS